MKQINVYFEDGEYEELHKLKDGMTWREFVLTLIKKEEKESGI